MERRFEPLAERFREVVRRDTESGLISDAEIAAWRYQELTRDEKQFERNTLFNGAEGFADWICQKDRTSAGQPFRSWGDWTMMPALAEPLISRCDEMQFEFLRSMGISESDMSIGVHEYSLRNTQDFLYSTVFASSPVRMIDFGAGYGRNAFLVSEYPDSVYCAIDSVEKNYCMQSMVLKHLYPEDRLFEYLDHPDADKEFVRKFVEQGGAVHVPTWRLDLVPAEMFNVLLMIWVFHEISESAAKALLDMLVDRMPMNSIVCFRGAFHSVAHNIDLGKELKSRDFQRLLELTPQNFDESLTSTSGKLIVYNRKVIQQQSSNPVRSAVSRTIRGTKQKLQVINR